VLYMALTFGTTAQAQDAELAGFDVVRVRNDELRFAVTYDYDEMALDNVHIGACVLRGGSVLPGFRCTPGRADDPRDEIRLTLVYRDFPAPAVSDGVLVYLFEEETPDMPFHYEIFQCRKIWGDLDATDDEGTEPDNVEDDGENGNANQDEGLDIDLGQVAGLVGALMGAIGDDDATPAPGDDILRLMAHTLNPHTAEFGVRYRYASHHGDNVYLGVCAVRGGSRQRGFAFTPAHIHHGTGVATVRLRFLGPGVTHTDGILIVMYRPGTGVFYSEYFRRPQTWHHF